MPVGKGKARAAFVIAFWSVVSAAELHCGLELVGSPIGTMSTRSAFVFLSTGTVLVAFVSVPVVVL